MKAKFRYVDLLVAGAVGSFIALIVHHQLCKAKAQMYIEQMGTNKPPIPGIDDEDDYGDAESYDYEHFSDVLNQVTPPAQDNQPKDSKVTAKEKVEVAEGTSSTKSEEKDA